MQSFDLIDCGGCPEIFADGVGDVQFLDGNTRIVLFKWRKVSGVIRRCIAAEIIRPTHTLTPGVVPVWQSRFASEARH